MGDIETKAAQKRKRANVEKIVLLTIASAGVLSAALVAPNVIGAMGKLGILPSPRQGTVVRRAQKRLEKKGLIVWKQHTIRLTKEGERALEFYKLQTEGVPRPKQWDKQWRVIIFDIPERRSATRRRLRIILRSLGLYCLQGSVWVYPYACEDALVLIKAELKIGYDVLYMVVREIENDKHLRSHFKLPRDG